jgi:hypothetical protein
MGRMGRIEWRAEPRKPLVERGTMSEFDERFERVQEKARSRDVWLPCLTESEVEAFERENRIELPRGYREFVMKVGNGGGTHPYYGMRPLSETLAYDTTETVVPHLEFPLTEFWTWDLEKDVTPEMEAEISKVRSQGFLCLGTDGCGIFWILVVSGKERGQVWWLCGEGAQPCAPRRDFLSWLEYGLGGGDDYFSEFSWPNGKPTPRPER